MEPSFGETLEHSNALLHNFQAPPTLCSFLLSRQCAIHIENTFPDLFFLFFHPLEVCENIKIKMKWLKVWFSAINVGIGEFASKKLNALLFITPSLIFGEGLVVFK